MFASVPFRDICPKKSGQSVENGTVDDMNVILQKGAKSANVFAADKRPWRRPGRPALNKRRAGLASGSIGDEVYTPSPRRQIKRRDRKNTLSEPRRRQNHYANTTNGQREPSNPVAAYFRPSFSRRLCGWHGLTTV